MLTINGKQPLDWIVVPYGLVETGFGKTGQASGFRHATGSRATASRVMCRGFGTQRTQVQGVGNGDLIEVLGRSAALS